jgi:HipA-like protein
VFSHLPEFVGEGGARVTTTLPVTAEPEFRTAGAVPPFFAGLLPEGRRLSALRAAMKTSGDDELSLLLAVGGDTVGDIQILPEGADLFVEDVAGAVDRVGGGTAQRSPTVDAEIVRDRDGALGLVGRFDRLPDGTMLAVEDGCQVLGRYPAATY